MRLFDTVHQQNLDRRELQLHLLVIVVVIILAAGLALLMYPAVFTQDVVLRGRTLRVAFFGFCGLSVLLVGYLLDRQLTVRQLRHRLMEELRRNVELRRQASADLLQTLPPLSHFEDRLAMEFRRAASTGRVLSVLVVALKPLPSLSDKSEITAAFGDAAKAMSHKLGAEDSVYLLCEGFFGMVLPGTDTVNAHRLSRRLEEGLQDAAGVTNRFAFDVRVINYPEDAKSAHELGQAVCSLLPEKQLDAGRPLA